VAEVLQLVRRAQCALRAQRSRVAALGREPPDSHAESDVENSSNARALMESAHVQYPKLQAQAPLTQLQI
jgi:hypothetical protein